MLALILATAVLPWFSPRRLRQSEALLLLIETFAALSSIRHISIYVLVAAPLVSAMVWDWLKNTRPLAQLGETQIQVKPAGAMVNAVFVIAVFAFTIARVKFVSAKQKAAEDASFPAAAVSFLQNHHPPGPILNYYTWGGYFIWKLYPEYRVFIDGRADVYGDTFMDQFASTYYVRGASWQETFQAWHISTVVMPPDAPLVSALRLSPQWEQVYGDPQAAVFSVKALHCPVTDVSRKGLTP
jgi:hypothetical protein